MAVINVNILSLCLLHNMDCTVILPDNIKKDEKLKAVWLYHGGAGDHKAWLYNTDIVDYVEKRHFAAILPTVHNSCFVDMNMGDKYGTYVGKELPNTIWNMFPCISGAREDNYICGFSNGGYGCLHTALTYPKLYSKVGAFSAGDKADADFPNDGGVKSITRIQLYGDGDLHKNSYGITFLGDKLIADNAQLPEIYHGCGSYDPWLSMNHILRDYFLSHKQYTYVYDEMEGLGHEWPFWEAELIKFLDFTGLNTKEKD